jgi:arylsulfatase A-like enzyme
MLRRVKPIVAFFLAALAGGLPGCGRGGPTRNLVIVSMDTVRADHLGCYGYAQKTTPEIDALAARGVLFENAMASSSWTTPSHASLFTGLLSSSHGAAQLNAPIRDDVPTLPEYLKRAGLATAGFVTHVFVGDHLGFARGFDKFWQEQDPRADRVVDAAQEWIDAQGRKPFFAFLHFFDPHHPYAPPDEYLQNYDDWCRKEKGDLGTLNKLFTPDRDKAMACALRRYDDEINFVDRQIGRLASGLLK